MIHEVKHSVETVFDVLRTKVGVTFVLLPDEATQKSHVNLKETRLMDECFRVFSCDSLRLVDSQAKVGPDRHGVC